MQESPDEAACREFVEAHLRVDLTFIDTDGRVDYKFADPDGRCAVLEVTTLTDQILHEAAAGYRKQSPGYQPSSKLDSCWDVTVDERHARFAGLPERLEQSLQVLEAVNLAEGGWTHPEQLYVQATSDGVRSAAASLAQEHVRFVSRWPRRLCDEVAGDSNHPHRIFVSRSGGHVAQGSDAALSLVESFVVAGADNLRKLREANAEVRHLFVQIDWATDGAVRRPFQGDDISEAEHFGKPSRDPELPPEVNELWVVYTSLGTGWHWSEVAGWESLPGEAR